MSCMESDIERAFGHAVLEALTAYELERQVTTHIPTARIAALEVGWEFFHVELRQLLREDT